MNPALQRIRKKVARGNVPGTIAVLAAIVELIEETPGETHVVASHERISDRCFLSRETVLARMKDLQEARIVRVSRVPFSRARKVELLNNFTALLNHSTAV